MMTLIIMCGDVAIDPESATNSDLAIHNELHPYFAGVDPLKYNIPQAGENGILMDGILLPHDISLPCYRFRDSEIKEAKWLTFVLVIPRNEVVDGLEFAPHRPFYISTTEISNAQYAQLFHDTALYDDYEIFKGDENIKARIDFLTNSSALPQIEAYLDNPNLPALVMSLEKASGCARSLSVNRGIIVGIPTISEWYCAMRAGADTHYWFGETVDDTVNWPGIHAGNKEYLSHLLEVDQGSENPWGIRNIVGNAAELVFPSEEERILLRKHFGPYAKKNKTKKDTGNALYITEYSALSLGGSVTTGIYSHLPGGNRERMKVAFDQSIREWKWMLLYGQIFENRGWLYQSHWCTTLRMTVELPDECDFKIIQVEN